MPTKNIQGERIQGNLEVTSVTGSFSGSLDGVASFATTASYAPATIYERKSDFQSPYLYCGTAISGSSPAANVWDVDRIEINISGSTTTQTAFGAWDDRTTLIYT